jgi:endonuclease YncB( thermonuclease family)
MFRSLVFLLLALPAVALAQFDGYVVDVEDGDTLTVRLDQQVLRLHLTDIDAPDAGEPEADDATRSLEELCEDKPVVVDDLGFGQGRRIFGRVTCAGVDAAAEQVRRGYARRAADP